MRTFELIAKETEEGKWEMKWRSLNGTITQAEMYWLFSVAAQEVMNKDKETGASGKLLLPSRN